jgi:hypothetical protein
VFQLKHIIGVQEEVQIAAAPVEAGKLRAALKCKPVRSSQPLPRNVFNIFKFDGFHKEVPFDVWYKVLPAFVNTCFTNSVLVLVYSKARRIVKTKLKA